MAQEQNFSSAIVAAMVPTAIHVALPLFWLICSMIIIPRYFAIAGINGEDIRDTLPVLFSFTQFMTKHIYIYLFVVALILTADATVYLSLLRVSAGMTARIWSFGVTIIEILISLFLYLPLRHVVASMGG